ncbi:MAG: BTAD domain-containing putative transcriptional regulator [Rubrivivax sp.]
MGLGADDKLHLIRLQLLGPPQLALADGRRLALNPQDAALLALLAIEGGVERERAAALLWPAADPQRAKLSLRQRLFRLNRAAGLDLVAGTRVLALAAEVGHDLRPLADPSTIGVGVGVDGEADPAAAVGELLGTLRYAGGELADWVDVARERWRLARRQRWAAQAAALEARGALAGALVLAQRLVDDDPAAEHAHRRLMRLHYLRGDRAAALAAFERCRRALAESLGEPPGAETMALLRTVEDDARPAAAAPRAPRPLALLRPPRLVGRGDAWQRLQYAQRRCQPVVLLGEPGIGKSRLLADWVHGRGLRLDARPGDAPVPWAVLTRLLTALQARCEPPADPALRSELARLLPVLGAPPAGTLQTVRLLAAVAAWLAAARAAGVECLAVDDLQFADAASIEALLALAGGGAAAAPAWLLAARAAECPPPLRRWVDAADPGQRALLLLQPLAEDGVHELLASLRIAGLDAGRWAAPLHRHTGGNPKFLLETLLASLDEAGALPAQPQWSLPPQVGELIDRRLARLSPPARRLAQLAALADVDFTIERAAALLAVHPLDLADPWRELEDAQIVAGSGFAHDLVREACLRSVPAAVAEALHAQIAAALAAAAPAVPAARLAEHWRRAGRWPEAAQAFRDAADAALHAGRRRDEAALLQAAADAHGHAGQPQPRFAALCERIGALVQCADGDELRAALRELDALPADAPQQALLALARAEVQIVFGEFDAVVAAMPGAIPLLPDAESALLATRRLAVAQLNLGQADQAAARLLQRLPAVDELPALRPRYEFLGELGTVLERCNRRREGLQHLQQGIALALQAGDQGTAATMYANLGINRVYWGDAEAAIEATERGLALRQAHDGIGGLASGFDMTLGAMCRDAGRYGEAIERLERSLAAFQADGNALWQANAGAHLATLWLHLGQAARAAGLLRQGDDQALPAFLAARRDALRARLEAAAGRPALPWLQQALQRLAGADRVDVRLGIELERLRWLAPAAALDLAEQLADEAERCELMGHAQAARLWRIDALLRAGRPDRAAELAAAAAGADAGAVVTQPAPSGAYRPELWALLLQGLPAGGGAAAKLRAAAAAWVRRAAAWLPAPFGESFLQRNAVNRGLLRPGA